MGISSNQARFLALTSRQIDLERRIQQICHRRLRLTTELEGVVTNYNNLVGNRQLYAFDTSTGGIDDLTIDHINALTDMNGNNYNIIGQYGTTLQYYSGYIEFNSGNSNLDIKAGPGATQRSITPEDLGLQDDASEEEMLDAALRAGMLFIGSVADEFTQESVTAQMGGAVTQDFELKDWRSLPSIADELYKGDDVEVENKYDATIDQINAQDKKLQMEQTSIEVEYKAITSEREAVKKVLDTNAQTSFKYFS